MRPETATLPVVCKVPLFVMPPVWVTAPPVASRWRTAFTAAMAGVPGSATVGVLAGEAKTVMLPLELAGAAGE